MATQGTDGTDRPSLSMGCGKPETVIGFYQSALEDHPELVHDLQELRRIITDLMQDDSGSRIASAIACSILNQQFQRSQTLHLTNPDGESGIVYYDNLEKIPMIWLGLINL